MKHVFIKLTISEFNSPFMHNEYVLWEKVDNGPLTHRKLNRQDAMRIQWELKKIGATREYMANLFNPSINYCYVTYFARH